MPSPLSERSQSHVAFMDNFSQVRPLGVRYAGLAGSIPKDSVITLLVPYRCLGRTIGRLCASFQTIKKSRENVSEAFRIIIGELGMICILACHDNIIAKSLCFVNTYPCSTDSLNTSTALRDYRSTSQRGRLG